MRMSKLLWKTLRSDPSNTETDSHRLMIKAGLIHQVSSGIYSYLPLAQKSLQKIQQIIREEMNSVGGQELSMSVLQPKELWEQSGRDESYGPDMFRLNDRRNRPLVLAPTHEELLTQIVKSHVQSYRDLPLILYQIQTKFRDELRPRGGLIRVREFDMKDAYSFDMNQNGLDLNYEVIKQAYKNIYSRCGLETIIVEADSGAIGGKDSHEFILVDESGEDTIIVCEHCDYAANSEKASFNKHVETNSPDLPTENVHTPDIATIESLSDFLSMPKSKILKTVVYSADKELVIVTTRGDLEINEVKLANLLKVKDLRLANHEEVNSIGLVPGYASPIGIINTKIIADDSVTQGSNLIAGSNRKNYHVKNVNYPKDFNADVIADISLAKQGFECSHCTGTLSAKRGIEVGHIFKLGTRYSEVLDAYVLNDHGKQIPMIMGCYGIGVGRLLAAIIQQNHDEKGIMFPSAVSPYKIHLLGLNLSDPEIKQGTDNIYEILSNSDIEVLYDDRIEESAGVKFNDADLLGLPLRLVVSKRNLGKSVVEARLRHLRDPEMLSMENIVETVKKLIQ